MDSDVTLQALYDWTCRMADDLEDLKGSFPDSVKVERNRVIASVQALGCALEFRVMWPFPKRPAPPLDGGGSYGGRTRRFIQDRGGTDGAGTATLGSR